MKIQAAPLIHARTRDVDFRAKLLVRPDCFADEDARWCRKMITQSTNQFEMCPPEGRRLLFCNHRFIVFGVSISIDSLCNLCGYEATYHRVDNNRSNYAFIGFVFPRHSVYTPFYIPLPMLYEQFQTYMELRWKDIDIEKCLEPTLVPFQWMDFPKEDADPQLKIRLCEEKQVFDTAAVSAKTLAASILAMMDCEWNPSFCSNLPSANAFLNSDFTIGLFPHASIVQNQVGTLCREISEIGSDLHSVHEKPQDKSVIDCLKDSLDAMVNPVPNSENSPEYKEIIKQNFKKLTAISFRKGRSDSNDF